MSVTDIYRIKTRNSIYEIQVHDQNGTTNRPSRCRKEGSETWKRVSDFSGVYLEELCIGPSFLIPGVVETSNVEDYVHFVVSTEPKRKAKASGDGIREFFAGLTDHLVQEIKGGRPIRAYGGYGPGCSEDNHVGSCSCDLPPSCSWTGCTYSSKHGPSHEGSAMCKSGSVASGGTRAHCACDYCY